MPDPDLNLPRAVMREFLCVRAVLLLAIGLPVIVSALPELGHPRDACGAGRRSSRDPSLEDPGTIAYRPVLILSRFRSAP